MKTKGKMESPWKESSRQESCICKGPGVRTMLEETGAESKGRIWEGRSERRAGWGADQVWPWGSEKLGLHPQDRGQP